MKPDFFTAKIALYRSGFIVVVTKDVTLQTVDENRTKEIARGIYGFRKYSVAKHFTKACNDAREDDVAHFYRCDETANQTN